jgi:hypothetical protein
MAEFRAVPPFVLNPQVGGMPAIGATSCGDCRPEHSLYDVLEVV